jgi:CRISPR/Cas system-associated protein Csm6
MQFFYGEKTVHRVLDEAEFWKQQEAEHTVVIREIVPNLEPQFVHELEEFKRRFEKTKGRVVRYIETVIRSKGHISPSLEQEILQLIDFAIRESQQFIMLLNRILAESNAVRSNLTAQVVINHIRRESEYFIGIAQTILRAK